MNSYLRLCYAFETTVRVIHATKQDKDRALIKTLLSALSDIYRLLLKEERVLWSDPAHRAVVDLKRAERERIVSPFRWFLPTRFGQY